MFGEFEVSVCIPALCVMIVIYLKLSVMIRLDRYIANLGLMSRRDVKPYMKRYEVLVNGILAN